MRIILASGSPRRKQLLEQAGIDFEVIVSEANEDIDGEPYEQVAALARRKAEAAAARISGEAIIIAADTLVYLESRNGSGHVLGKPTDAQDAFDMLYALQGRKHTVYTGVALLKKECGEISTDSTGIIDPLSANVFVDAAYVYFRPLTEREIRAYIATGEPFDKAGAYGIQEKGALLIERVEGDFYTVMGLPISKLCVQLEEMGVQIWESSE
ncbi:MAG: Maf family protein [Defluviitaleaceae bacterium]|nr:Maf family protein [Defluviitaleaceae bacterium]